MGITEDDPMHFDFEEAARGLGPSAFTSPYRSTVPLLSFMKSGDRLISLLEKLQLGPDSALHLEYTVAPPRGKGKVSCTDLMVIDGARSVAIEAKWTEPRYETVSEWLAGGTQENRQEVLEGWLDLIRQFTTAPVPPDDLADLQYQTLHRAASACSTSNQPSVAYVVFVAADTGQKPESSPSVDLELLRNRVGADTALGLALVTVEMEPTAAFAEIRDLAKGRSETGVAVMDALLEKDLFEFSQPTSKRF